MNGFGQLAVSGSYLQHQCFLLFTLESVYKDENTSSVIWPKNLGFFNFSLRMMFFDISNWLLLTVLKSFEKLKCLITDKFSIMLPEITSTQCVSMCTYAWMLILKFSKYYSTNQAFLNTLTGNQPITNLKQWDENIPHGGGSFTFRSCRPTDIDNVALTFVQMLPFVKSSSLS